MQVACRFIRNFYKNPGLAKADFCVIVGDRISLDIVVSLTWKT